VAERLHEPTPPGSPESDDSAAPRPGPTGEALYARHCLCWSKRCISTGTDHGGGTGWLVGSTVGGQRQSHWVVYRRQRSAHVGDGCRENRSSPWSVPACYFPFTRGAVLSRGWSLLNTSSPIPMRSGD